MIENLIVVRAVPFTNLIPFSAVYFMRIAKLKFENKNKSPIYFPKTMYTNSLVNADLFYENFTNTTFQKIPIPHLTHIMKQKFLY